MRLGVVSGPHTGRVVQIEGALTVGRSGDCDLSLNDPKVSRRHATVTRAATGGLHLHDDNSLNGTWVNDRRIAAVTALRAGDRVRIGSSEFVVVVDGHPDDAMLTERDFDELLAGTADDRTVVVGGDTK
jgi:pSer/pThr/pTyr-binding forkhead associated (FHA) protein